MPFRLADTGTRRFRRLCAGSGLLVLVIIVLPVFAASVWWLSGPTMAARSTGTNALWLSHAWAGSAHTEAKYARLAELLRRNQISDAYFHVGPIEGDGAIPPARYMHAPELVAALHRLAPGVHIQAYAGQVLVGAGGPLELRSAAVRDRILGTARALLDLGFAGIHYDIEPLTPTDDDFLDLLERTHAMTGERGAILSASIPRLAPVHTTEHAPAWPGPFTTGTYLRQVATRVEDTLVDKCSGVQTPGRVHLSSLTQASQPMAARSGPASGAVRRGYRRPPFGRRGAGILGHRDRQRIG